MKKAPLTLTSLARELCKREGKKKQVNIAQMREILGCLVDIFNERPFEFLLALSKAAKER